MIPAPVSEQDGPYTNFACINLMRRVRAIFVYIGHSEAFVDSLNNEVVGSRV